MCPTVFYWKRGGGVDFYEILNRFFLSDPEKNNILSKKLRWYIRFGPFFVSQNNDIKTFKLNLNFFDLIEREEGCIEGGQEE